jgi:hypothetical protein
MSILDRREPTVPLPKGWPRVAKSAIVHAVALAHFVVAHVRGWCVDSPLRRVRLAGECERLRSEVAMLREELRIKDTRLPRATDRAASEVPGAPRREAPREEGRRREAGRRSPRRTSPSSRRSPPRRRVNARAANDRPRPRRETCARRGRSRRRRSLRSPRTPPGLDNPLLRTPKIDLAQADSTSRRWIAAHAGRAAWRAAVVQIHSPRPDKSMGRGSREVEGQGSGLSSRTATNPERGRADQCSGSTRSWRPEPKS